jgi:hypothetical protein
VLPALPISLSPKYQTELALPVLGFGVGYLPVYAQYFGVALLLLAGAMLGWRLLERPAVAAGAALLVALIVGHTYAANLALVRNLYAWERGIRDNLEGALATGLLDEVPEGATVLLDNPHGMWHHDCPFRKFAALGSSALMNFGEYFYYLHSGKKVHVVVHGSPNSPSALLDGKVHEVRDALFAPRRGFVLLIQRNSLSTPWTDDVRLYFHGDSNPSSFLLRGQRASGHSLAEDVAISIRGSDLVVLRRGPRGIVCSVPHEWGPFVASSLTVIEIGRGKRK